MPSKLLGQVALAATHEGGHLGFACGLVDHHRPLLLHQVHKVLVGRLVVRQSKAGSTQAEQHGDASRDTLDANNTRHYCCCCCSRVPRADVPCRQHTIPTNSSPLTCVPHTPDSPAAQHTSVSLSTAWPHRPPFPDASRSVMLAGHLWGLIATRSQSVMGCHQNTACEGEPT